MLLLVAVTWIGGEEHYRNCLSSVDMRYPLAYRQPLQGSGNAERAQFGLPRGWEAEPGGFVVQDSKGREEAIAGCSRWP
jgi:hypothetical protein